MADGNKSVVILASTSLAFVDNDSRVQFTRTPDGSMFVTVIVGNEANARVHLRITPEEWSRLHEMRGLL